MREMGLAQNIFDIVLRTAEQYNVGKVMRINVRAGQLRGIVPEQLQFCFGFVAKESTVVDGAELVIETLPIKGKCKSCGQIHFPAQRVCYTCYAKDQWEPVRLSDRRGKLLAYTFDYFFPSSEPPTIMIMTEVEGCRVQVQLCNAQADDVRLDMPVEYVFRIIHQAGGKPNYFWKASPVADA